MLAPLSRSSFTTLKTKKLWDPVKDKFLSRQKKLSLKYFFNRNGQAKGSLKTRRRLGM